MAMEWIQVFQVFLLDFDGLLVNTEHMHFAAYQEMTKQRGHHLNWNYDRFLQIAHLSSSGLRETVYGDLPALYEEEPNWEVLYKEKKAAYEKLLDEGEVALLPGVKELLMALEQAGKKRAVITNSTRLQAEAVKKRIPLLQTVPLWITREDYKSPKPHPECYEIAIKKLAHLGDKVVGFEDSTRGVEALLGAGVKNAILICPSSHPQLALPNCPKVPHFSTFFDVKF